MYNHTNDLHRVCRELRNSKLRYAPKMEPFQVFSPMLAKRVEFGEAVIAINTEKFVMEPKLDGERIICHIKEEEIQFISRNGINYTEQYGPSMIPYIKTQVMQGIDCILDGEMMVWDNLEYKFREFGLLKNVANAFRNEENKDSLAQWLCYIVWDIVYLGGTNTKQIDTLLEETYHGAGKVTGVMGLPLFARRKLLVKIVKPLDHRLMIIEQKIVNGKSQKERHEMVMAEIDRQITNGGEGIILKDLEAHYMCGENSRKTKKWIKLKPDYAGMTTNLDVIILGGFYGTGRKRSGNVSVFLVGVLSRSIDEKEAKEIEKKHLQQIPSFYTFSKIGTGYNFEELEQMRIELEPFWKKWEKEKIPPHLNGWIPSKKDLIPDVWIDPRHSKILEVYGFELTFTTLYQTGLTIRFPRCKTIRHDKPWYSCMTVQELNTIKRRNSFNKRAVDVAFGQKKKKKITRLISIISV
jgi:DNA ligase-4